MLKSQTITTNLVLAMLFIVTSQFAMGQEIKIFTVQDFDLKGKVKSNLVTTKYGKEEYNFNEAGVLTKSVTRYNDLDYDITYYKFINKELIEKRLETYRNDTIDVQTSIANVYTIDSTANRKVTEKIVAYTKEFLEQYEYTYDKANKLVHILRTNDAGVDDTTIEYSNYKGEKTVTHKLNGTIQKSVRTSIKKVKGNAEQHVVLTKKFLEGNPNTAVEDIYDTSEKLLTQTKFVHNTKTKQFVIEELLTYTYDEKGMLSKLEIERGNQKEVKEYIYQFDNGDEGNWIKEIIIPDNTYTTRKISYYEVEGAEENQE